MKTRWIAVEGPAGALLAALVACMPAGGYAAERPSNPVYVGPGSMGLGTAINPENHPLRLRTDGTLSRDDFQSPGAAEAADEETSASLFERMDQELDEMLRNPAHADRFVEEFDPKDENAQYALEYFIQRLEGIQSPATQALLGRLLALKMGEHDKNLSMMLDYAGNGRAENARLFLARNYDPADAASRDALSYMLARLEGDDRTESRSLSALIAAHLHPDRDVSPPAKEPKRAISQRNLTAAFDGAQGREAGDLVPEQETFGGGFMSVPDLNRGTSCAGGSCSTSTASFSDDAVEDESAGTDSDPFRSPDATPEDAGSEEPPVEQPSTHVEAYGGDRDKIAALLSINGEGRLLPLHEDDGWEVLTVTDNGVERPRWHYKDFTEGGATGRYYIDYDRNQFWVVTRGADGDGHRSWTYTTWILDDEGQPRPRRQMVVWRHDEGTARMDEGVYLVQCLTCDGNSASPAGTPAYYENVADRHAIQVSPNLEVVRPEDAERGQYQLARTHEGEPVLGKLSIAPDGRPVFEYKWTVEGQSYRGRVEDRRVTDMSRLDGNGWQNLDAEYMPPEDTTDATRPLLIALGLVDPAEAIEDEPILPELAADAEATEESAGEVAESTPPEEELPPAEETPSDQERVDNALRIARQLHSIGTTEWWDSIEAQVRGLRATNLSDAAYMLEEQAAAAAAAYEPEEPATEPDPTPGFWSRMWGAARSYLIWD